MPSCLSLPDMPLLSFLADKLNVLDRLKYLLFQVSLICLRRKYQLHTTCTSLRCDHPRYLYVSLGVISRIFAPFPSWSNLSTSHIDESPLAKGNKHLEMSIILRVLCEVILDIWHLSSCASFIRGLTMQFRYIFSLLEPWHPPPPSQKDDFVSLNFVVRITNWMDIWNIYIYIYIFHS